MLQRLSEDLYLPEQPEEIESQEMQKARPLSFVSRFDRSGREGMNSEIWRVVPEEDKNIFTQGKVIDGRRVYPSAYIPIDLLRIEQGRTREEFEEALKNYAILEQYLAPSGNLAESEHVIVETVDDFSNFVDILNFTDETNKQIQEIINLGNDKGDEEKQNVSLLSSQDYVGEAPLDTYFFREALSYFNIDKLMDLAKDGNPYSIGSPRLYGSVVFRKEVIQRFKASLITLIEAVKNMIIHEKKIPDLGGMGNLKLRLDGTIVLVDINNVFDCDENTDITERDNNGIAVVYHSFEVLRDMMEYLNMSDNELDDYFRMLNGNVAKSLEIIDKDTYTSSHLPNSKFINKYLPEEKMEAARMAHENHLSNLDRMETEEKPWTDADFFGAS